MTRLVPEWVGATPDAAIPPRVRARIVLRFNGHCPKCTRRLEPGKYALDHIVALANGGRHAESNLQPLCVSPCHSEKTRADVAEKSVIAKKRNKHLGIKGRRRTIAGRRFNGEPIPPRWVGAR